MSSASTSSPHQTQLSVKPSRTVECCSHQTTTMRSKHELTGQVAAPANRNVSLPILAIVCCISAIAASVITALVIPAVQSGAMPGIGEMNSLRSVGANLHCALTPHGTIAISVFKTACQVWLPVFSAIITGAIPIIYTLLCLRFLSNVLAQELGKMHTRSKSLDNFFTSAFKYHYSHVCCGLLQAVLNV